MSLLCLASSLVEVPFLPIADMNPASQTINPLCPTSPCLTPAIVGLTTAIYSSITLLSVIPLFTLSSINSSRYLVVVVSPPFQPSASSSSASVSALMACIVSSSMFLNSFLIGTKAQICHLGLIETVSLDFDKGKVPCLFIGAISDWRDDS